MRIPEHFRYLCARMTFDEEVVVLNSTRARDGLEVLHCLGRSTGRRSFLLRVGKSSRMSLLLPFSLLEISITENPRSELWTAKPVGLKHPLAGVRGDIRKNTMTLFMAELIYRTVKDGSAEEGLYDWCEGQILTLDALQTDYSNFPLYFLLSFCSALGFRPSAKDMLPFSREHQAVLERLMRSDLPSAMLLPLSGSVRNGIASSIVRYLEYHTESSIHLRSLGVLREFYSGQAPE